MRNDVEIQDIPPRYGVFLCTQSFEKQIERRESKGTKWSQPESSTLPSIYFRCLPSFFFSRQNFRESFIEIKNGYSSVAFDKEWIVDKEQLSFSKMKYTWQIVNILECYI
jgi:hypothetical protein